MKKNIYIFLAFVVAACANESSPEQQAAQVALQYYSRLLEGYPDGFMAGRAGTDTLPTHYRNQLVKAGVQYAEDIKRLHNGIRSVSISSNVGRRDSIQGIVYAFLLLSFNDSTVEEIAVPMVQCEGEWLMK